MIRRNKTWELQVFVGYIRHTNILLPKERFMKWGHHHLKSPKVNGPSWISTLWLKKGIVTFPLSHQKSFLTCLNLSTVFVFVLMLLGNSCLNAGNVCLNAGYSCPIFFAKKMHKMSQCAWNIRTCSKLILKNITVHLGCPKQIPPNMFRALSHSTGAHSQVSTCPNFYSTVPIFNRIQAEAGLISW